jgi:hypothetical protein
MEIMGKRECILLGSKTGREQSNLGSLNMVIFSFIDSVFTAVGKYF